MLNFERSELSYSSNVICFMGICRVVHHSKEYGNYFNSSKEHCAMIHRSRRKGNPTEKRGRGMRVIRIHELQPLRHERSIKLQQCESEKPVARYECGLKSFCKMETSSLKQNGALSPPQQNDKQPSSFGTREFISSICLSFATIFVYGHIYTYIHT